MGEIIAFILGCLITFLIQSKKEKSTDDSKVLTKLDELAKQFDYHKHYMTSQHHLKDANKKNNELTDKLKKVEKALSDIKSSVSKAIK